MDKSNDLYVLVRDLTEADAQAWAERVAPGHFLLVGERVEDGPFTSLYFPSGGPWADYAALAHAAAEAFGREALYEVPELNPYSWYSVSPAGEEMEVSWGDDGTDPEPRYLRVRVRDVPEAAVWAWAAARVAPGWQIYMEEGIDDGPFTEVWLPAGRLWPNRAALARAVAEAFGREALYIAPGYGPSDEWRSVSAGGKEAG